MSGLLTNYTEFRTGKQEIIWIKENLKWTLCTARTCGGQFEITIQEF